MGGAAPDRRDRDERLPRGGISIPGEAEAGLQGNLISLEVTESLRRSRLTVFFRWLLAFPHYLWLSGWTIAAAGAAVAQWLFMLVSGRPAAGLHRFLTSYLRYSTHVGAYLYLVGNPFPEFLGRRGDYTVDLLVPGPEPQPRWMTFLRLVLAIPVLVFSQVLARVAEVVAFLAWFACVALGRTPKGMRDLNAYCLRYQQQTLGYLLLLTDRYPQLASAEVYSTTVAAPSDRS